MPASDLLKFRRNVGTATKTLDKQRDAVAIARQKLIDIDREATAPDADRQALADRRATALGKIEDARRLAADTEKRLRDLLDLTPDDPCACASDVPLLLLPVRIETRFVEPAPAQGARLQVRIFPDTVHVDALRRTLSDAERAAGVVYWNAMWLGTAPEQAWTALKLAVGLSRAPWVAETTRPSNPADAPGGTPVFPEASPPIKDSVVARLLPDKFVVVARQGRQEVRATGKAIATDPEMGAFLPDEDEVDLITINGVTVSKESQWIVDFDAAVEAGMALTLDLPNAGAVDELFVFGVRRSLAPADAATALEALLTAHRFSVGLDFVPQGTPTNNLDDAASGWRANGGSDLGPTLSPAPVSGGSASALATAFGIDATVFGSTEHGNLDEDPIARACNSVVWSGSIEGFLDAFETVGDTNGVAAISTSDRESLRRLHLDTVRGRGPLPAVRLGKQPYGILPVGSTSRLWEESDRFLGKALPIVRNARAMWTIAATGLPHIVPSEGSSDATMQALLGMSPISLGLRGREALSSEMGRAFGSVTGAVDTSDELSTLLFGMFSPNGNDLVYHYPGAVLGKSKPIGLPYADPSDSDALTALAADPHRKLEVKSVLQALAQLAWSRVSDRVDSNGGSDVITTVASNVTGFTATDVREVRNTAARAADATPEVLFKMADAFVATAPVAPTLQGASLAAYQPDMTTRTSFAALAATSTTTAGRDEFARFALPEWFIGFGVRAELIEALKTLAAEPSLDKRRIALAEALDVASHRLDAWTTALVESRRRTLRAKNPEGLHIGAFGWVTDIQPRNVESGYLHAPSMAQAVTAGILRSAYNSHNANGDAASDGAFAIDLTSTRVRDALDVLDAVREGQGLSAALGYRIERALHEAELDRLVLNLRAAAPLAAGRLVDDGNVPQDVATHLAIANVVDGVTLIEKARNDFAAIVTIANEPPKDNPFIDPAGWPSLDADETAKLEVIFADAEAVLDASADVLLAESVHHLAQGNMARAAAAIDASANGDSSVPVPEFIATPPTGAFVTHRLLLIVQNGDDWGSSQPRALAEPMLERWAAARLGAANSIVVVVQGGERTMAETGLCALDIVFGSSDPAALAAIIRLRLDLADDAPIVDGPAADWAIDRRAFGDVVQAAAALRTVLAAATPALPGELGVPAADPPGREFAPDAISDAVSRAQHARTALASRSDDLAAAITSGDPNAVTRSLFALADFGIIPPGGNSGGDIAKLAAEVAIQRLVTVDAAIAALDDPDIAALNTVAVALFGEGFLILPVISTRSGAPFDQWDAALAQQDSLATPAQIRRWLSDSGAIREPIMRYGDTLLLADALATAPKLSALQVARVGQAQPTTWIGSELAEGITASFVIESLGWDDPKKPAAMLVLDHYVERLPGTDEITSGIAFNAPSPNARPPQAWLLAVAPKAKDWTSDTVLETLRDTVALARIRGVALEHQPYAARMLPVLYQQSWSLRGENVIDFSKFALDIAASASSLSAMRFVKDN